MTPGVLYISYDGMLEPLGQSQVLAYLKRLAVGRRIHLISFEKPEDWANVAEREQLAQDIAAAAIVWHPLSYHKRPSAVATAWDVWCGITLGLWLVLRHRLRIVHARSYVSSVIALALKRFTGVKYIFDMRGFWADERVDGGLWPSGGRLYRVAKGFERHFLLVADHVVSLTHAAVREMQRFHYLQGRMPPVTVIPTCADLSRFKPMQRDQIGGGFVLGYVGSAGTWYLFDEVATCFAQLLRMRADARFVIVNRSEHTYIRERLAAAGVPDFAVEITVATHAEVPRQMSRMDAGIFFIKPVFSKQASAPTKLAEFLGCGIPCLSNAGVGDMAELLEGERVGVAIKLFDSISMTAALQRLIELVADSATSARCVTASQRHFALDKGVEAYSKIYSKLMGMKMTDADVQPCTVCGSAAKGSYLFEKPNSNLSIGSIKIYQCGACKSIYLGQYGKYYDNELYAYYTKYSGETKDQVYNPLTKKSYLKVLKLLESYGGGKKVLDVGCGNGSFVDAAMEQGYNIKGIELSQTAVDIAQAFNLPVQNVDFFSSEIEASSFDVLTMFEVIEHLPEPVRFLKRAEQVVKPGGLIYLTTPNFKSLDRRVLGKNWNVFHREHLTYFTPATLMKAISANTRFEVLHVETRNVSGELIATFGHLMPSFLSRDSRCNSNHVSGQPPPSDTRTRIAKSPWLSLLKQWVNFFLNATGMGSTIVILLRRPL